MGWRIEGNKVIPQPSLRFVEKLPKGTYYLRYNEMQQSYYLEKVEDFKLPKKIYGDCSVVDRWIKSYKNNERNTGVLLSGIKGSGKTLLSKKLAIDSDLPVVIIDQPYEDTNFVSFITSPELGDICVFIDEFEKIYNDRDTESGLLSILDGSFKTHNLFVFTCNQMNVSEYLINRPSRIRYRTHFESLDQSVINEVIDDLLEDKTQKDSIFTVLDLVGIVTYDILISLIREMNLFKESAIKVAQYLNLKSEEFTVTCYELWDGQRVELEYKYATLYPDSDVSLYRDFDKNQNIKGYHRLKRNDEDEFMGLPVNIEVPRSSIKKVSQNKWESKTELGHFVFERKFTTYLF
jgi:SpoVK/Ycf46/Vps4 family AAA+-type ATPase